MQDQSEAVEKCQACGIEMDVSAVGPFSNVACPGCGEHNRVKRVLGPYLLERRHSIGGMSTIFVARDQTLNREVAVKLLSEQWCSDEKRIAAFVEEARLTASLSHPNIVRVFRTGWAYGRFYIAMELVAGAHLEHWITQQGKLTELEVLNMAIQVAQGLKAAQLAGLIHRDMKPGNILMDEQGSAKIVDFGLALVTHGGSVTAAELWATPYYVPPEAVDGKPETFRSDMYSFGATLYHALAGVPPCAEESMATDKLREAKKNVRLLQRVAPDITNATCRIVNRAMSYEPQDRFPSYDEMISLLEESRRRLLIGDTKDKQPGKGFPVGTFIFLLLLAGAGGAAWWWKDQLPGLAKKVSDLPKLVTPHKENKYETPADASLYRNATRALFAGDNKEALRLFISLRDGETTMEPTATWAGAEATLAAGLTGDFGLARKHAQLTLQHAQSVDMTDPVIRGSLMPLLQKYERLQVLPSDGVADGLKSNADLLIALLAGIKNWEQGIPKDGLPFFEAVSAAQITGADEWTEFYQKTAAHYQADFVLLQDPVFDGYPTTSAECEQAIEKLDGFVKQLQTEGRARFNIRAWQLDLAKQAKRLRLDELKSDKNKPKVEVEETVELAAMMDFPATVVKKTTEFSSTYDFKSAEKYLKSQGETDLSLGLLDAATSAHKLIDQLTDDLKKEPAALPIQLRSGAKIATLSADGSGSLTAGNGSGKTISVAWADISADGIIALHRNSVKNVTDSAEVARRHANAIFFDWLAGNRTRAENTADRFSQSSPDFKKRWQSFVSNLP